MILTADEIRKLIININNLQVENTKKTENTKKYINNMYYVLEEPDIVHIICGDDLLKSLMSLWKDMDKNLSVARKIISSKSSNTGIMLDDKYTKVICHGTTKGLVPKAKINGGKLVYFLEETNEPPKATDEDTFVYNLNKNLSKKGKDTYKDKIRRLTSITNIDAFLDSCDIKDVKIRQKARKVIKESLEKAFAL